MLRPTAICGVFRARNRSEHLRDRTASKKETTHVIVRWK